MSYPILANETLSNIEKTEEGYLLTQDQIISLANYIAELRADNERLNAKLDEAMKQLEEAYEQKPVSFIQRLGDGITGAGIASLLILIAGGIQ